MSSRFDHLKSIMDAPLTTTPQTLKDGARELLVERLLKDADDIKLLWQLTFPEGEVSPLYQDTYYRCPACGSSSASVDGIQHDPDCPHEALRYLFGEVFS